MGIIKHKRLSKARSITVPKDMAASIGMFPSSAVDLIEQEDGILIRKHVKTCVYCGSIESVDTIMGKEVCAKCAYDMRQEIDNKYA